MSEPTYRVELTHNPALEFSWKAELVRIADDSIIRTCIDDTREKAFDRAQEVARGMVRAHNPSTVYLSEDGDILDPHEVQR